MLHHADSLADTIVARATPPGEGAVAVVRLSGPRAIEIGALLAPAKTVRRSHQLLPALVRSPEGELLDSGMVVEMRAPRSYTGEDVVELQLHGSRSVVDGVIRSCIDVGARLARPGEFTLRAFLNGRIDLCQAEAIGELIVSGNETQRGLANDQLQGGLSRLIQTEVERLEGVLAEVRAALDFPEDSIGNGLSSSGKSHVNSSMCTIQTLLKNARLDGLRGLRVVLCGAANVGKSTLLNALAGEERVLVDPEPGTTRDPVEVELTRGLIRWSVCDTAGVRSGAEGLEARGISMSVDRIKKSDLALWLVDPDAPIWPDPELDVCIVGSKSDLASSRRRSLLEDRVAEQSFQFHGWVSPRNGDGVDELRDRLLARFDSPIREGGVVVVRERHFETLRRSRDALERFQSGCETGATLDVLSIELEEATLALGEILGRNVDMEVLDRIFSEFCIGK